VVVLYIERCAAMAHIPASVIRAVNEGNVSMVKAWLMRDDRSLVINESLTPGVENDKLINRAIEGGRSRQAMGQDSANVSAMVELLLQAGASPEVVFLMHAISTENVEVALLLMAHGVDVKEPYGVWTPLHYAARMGERRAMPRQEELIRAMLDAGAPVDARTESTLPGTDFDVTPLMEATGCGYTSPDVLKLLLKYGSDVDAVSSHGRTAEDHARAALNYPIGPHQDELRRGPGVVEGSLALFRDYRAAGGTWKRYVAEPRKQLLVLRRLVERGRAAPPDGTLARVQGLPDVLFWKVLAFWRSARDV
jgi:hypothetical protein